MTADEFDLFERRIEQYVDNRIQLYQMQLETQAQTLKDLQSNTAEIVEAFQAAKGAFVVLGWIGKASKPILWIGGVIALLSTFWNSIKVALKAVF